ncbi:Lar family restriction alleviation protein [Providencia stuartii]
MSELKKCPFCGCGITSLTTYKNECKPDYYKVECIECKSATGSKDNKSEAISAWNRRANSEN